MAAKRKIAIVGPGRLGKALAENLAAAGYPITEIVSQSRAGSRQRAKALAAKVKAVATDGKRVKLDADVIWFCVPDGQIRAAARKLAGATDWRKRIAFHSSGALSGDELAVLKKKGATIASVHPLMTFVAASVPSLEGVPFAIEGDRAAVRVAREMIRMLGGEPFVIKKEDKAAYHAWGAFASPLLIAMLVTAEQVARSAGVRPTEARKKMLPIVRQTLANYAVLGPAGAFSGPLVRGDAGIVRKHLQVLKSIPEARKVYSSLAGMALRYLPVRQREALKRALR